MELFSGFRRAMRIRLKIMALTLGTVFLSVFLLSALATSQYQALLLEKTEEVCSNLSKNLSIVAREELLTHHTMGTYEGTRNATTQIKAARVAGLLNSYVVYSEGQVVAHTSEDKVGETAPAADLAEFRTFKKLEKQEKAGASGAVLRFVDPIFVDLPGNKRPLLGWVVFEFDRKSVYSPIEKVRLNIEYLSVILLIASAVVAAVLSRRLSRPIEDLAKAAEELGRGNLG
ncbi:MAG: hypothetical protein HY042_01830, partial [Spirochaetia bacterium]|nr:hypothetical protein [Spirochaetia bacterium]